MRFLHLVLLCAAVMPASVACASFTWTPAPATVVDAPIIRETAREVWAGEKPANPAPLVNQAERDRAVEKAVRESRREAAQTGGAATTPATVPVAGAAPVRTTVSPVPLLVPPQFILNPGSLREQLEAYAKRNGFQLAWNHPEDLQVGNTTTFTGGFVDNVRQLFETLQDIGRWDFAATLFEGNHTLVVDMARR